MELVVFAYGNGLSILLYIISFSAAYLEMYVICDILQKVTV